MRKAKVADHVDATGRLVGRRIVLSNMSDVERLESNFCILAKRKTECSLLQCIDNTWRSFAELMPGSEESSVTLRTAHGKVVGVTVPIMGHHKSRNP